MRRMDRYEKPNENTQPSRSNKNQELYQNLGRNTRYTNLSEVTSANAIDLTIAKENSQTREGYHQMKEYHPSTPVPKIKKELDDFNQIYHTKENKVYDINSVLEEARKNRIDKDRLEEKRKLKNTNYNILAALNPEELEKYRQEKKNRVIKPEENELRELIDTITSKTLAGEIDKATSVNLLSELMATNVMDKIEDPNTISKENKEVSNENKELEKSIEIEISEKVEIPSETSDNEKIDEQLALSKKILDKKEISEINSNPSNDSNKSTDESTALNENNDKMTREEKYNNVKKKKKKKKASFLNEADSDFYTKTDHDMAFFDDESKGDKMPFLLKLIIFLIIVAITAAASYFIWKNIIK